MNGSELNNTLQEGVKEYKEQAEKKIEAIKEKFGKMKADANKKYSADPDILSNTLTKLDKDYNKAIESVTVWVQESVNKLTESIQKKILEGQEKAAQIKQQAKEDADKAKREFENSQKKASNRMKPKDPEKFKLLMKAKQLLLGC